MADDRRDDVESRVRASFDKQGFMSTLAAKLTAVTPGMVEIEAAAHPHLTQQQGHIHGGVTMALVDTACGYAALSLAEQGAEVLTVELKVNLLAPAAGERLRAVGRVIRSGRTLTICQGDVYVHSGDDAEAHVASALTTMMTVRPRIP